MKELGNGKVPGFIDGREDAHKPVEEYANYCSTLRNFWQKSRGPYGFLHARE